MLLSTTLPGFVALAGRGERRFSGNVVEIAADHVLHDRFASGLAAFDELIVRHVDESGRGAVRFPAAAASAGARPSVLLDDDVTKLRAAK